MLWQVVWTDQIIENSHTSCSSQSVYNYECSVNNTQGHHVTVPRDNVSIKTQKYAHFQRFLQSPVKRPQTENCAWQKPVTPAHWSLRVPHRHPLFSELQWIWRWQAVAQLGQVAYLFISDWAMLLETAQLETPKTRSRNPSYASKNYLYFSQF